ncbi:MAG: bifunctional oligoribonuclease/PAP phosphatase NrnA [Candidatus Manganitrophaceae bacterium]|nr:MAG: bifunctional oligoribonuclease/PAP phosphatase NrnA [Candidatus Manganitrophaceae bacterium]
MSLPQVVSVLQEKQSFIITGHVSPEGDAIGSGMALALALRDMGKKAEVINKDPIPQQLLFLPHEGLFSQQKAMIQPADALIVVDSGSFERTGYTGSDAIPLLINIDHHITNPSYGHINWVLPTAMATGEMIYDLLKAMGTRMTPSIATCIYTALITETGSFRYVNTTSRALQIAGEMIEQGADPFRIATALFEANSSGRLKLLAEVLAKMELSADERIAWIEVTQAQLRKTGTTLEDTEDFVTYPRSVEKVEVAVFFREVGPEQYKISFRSQGKVDVALLAKRWGGGGHIYAAGCTRFGPWEKVRDTILASVQEAVYQAVS